MTLAEPAAAASIPCNVGNYMCYVPNIMQIYGSLASSIHSIPVTVDEDDTCTRPTHDLTLRVVNAKTTLSMPQEAHSQSLDLPLSVTLP